MAAEPASTADNLAAVRAQRADLHADLVRLEAALAGATPGRVGDWANTVHDVLVDTAATFERHIAVTEGPDGLFDDVVRAAPRLANHVRGLTDEHRGIRALIADQLTAARALARRGDLAGVEALRETVTDLIAKLSRHRQRGADLVYEAYAVDLGAGD
jgi:hypothetical protein